MARIKLSERKIYSIDEDWGTDLSTLDETKFNNWLSKNVLVLEDILEIPNIYDAKREHQNKDNKRLDILAKYEDEEGKEQHIAIESQLTPADFSHLGRLIMYLATVQERPKKLVWIVSEKTFSHEETISWLNNHIAGYDFWMIRPIIVTINSNRGIEFEVIVRPNPKEKTNILQNEISLIQKESSLQQIYTSFWEVFSKVEESEDKFSQRFGKAGRGARGYTYLKAKREFTLAVALFKNEIRIDLSTKDKAIQDKWIANDLGKKLGGWTYDERGQKTPTYFCEKILFKNWQENENKWEEYIHTTLEEAFYALEAVEKL